MAKLRVLLLIAALSGAGASADEPTHHNAVPAQAETLQEVTVTAQHALAERVTHFINQISALQNEESLPRWHDPVCPSVTGLPAPEGEYLLGRFSDIARAAAVPLAGDHCRVNLMVLVTPQPVALLKALEKRSFASLFGENAMPTQVDAFMNISRPVRVWYNSSMKTPEHLPMHPGAPPFTMITGSFGTSPMKVYHDSERSSHTTLAHVWDFSMVFVVVDQTQLKGVSRAQLADYVSLVSLADIKPGAQLGEAPTLLKLFDGGPQAAPPGLSDWDQAFLKALYGTDQKSLIQRSLMSKTLVRDITH